MKPIILFFGIFFFAVTCHAQAIEKQGRSLPVVDKAKSYPTRKIEYDIKTTYIPLETSKEVLLGGQCKLNYVSDEKFVLTDELSGDVFIFGKDGKIRSSFNQRGGMGYTFISFVAYDESNNELFILDTIKKKIFVYFQNGTLRRSFSMPQNTWYREIYNFDNNTLLAFDEDINGSSRQIKPYAFISKSDGKILSYVNIELEKVNPTRLEGIGKGGASSMIITHSGIPDNCKFGNDFILANKSMNTVYMLKQDKTLIPLFTQTPSVFSEHPTAVSVGMVTPQFLTFTVSSYEMNEAVKVYEAGGNWKPKFKHFILDLNSGEFFQDADKGNYSVYKIDTPKNQVYKLMQAVNLINANKKGLLKGKLKEVASKLQIGDNPVIEIQKLKKTGD